MIDWPEQMHNLKVKLKQGSENLYYLQLASDVETWPEVADAIAAFAVDKDPFLLSTTLDTILCKYLSDVSQFGLFFSTYYRLYFDLENIRNFFRARQFEKSREIFEQVFIDYGTLNESVFIDHIAHPYDAFAKSLFTTPYAHIADRGGAYLEDHHSFLRLERLCDEMKLRFLVQARNMTFGVEPLFCYYEFKLAEIKKLRQVYWGRLNELPIEELRESIPDVW
jgi:vacuolar-type H+-ATPase subunit C/Vma6